MRAWEVVVEMDRIPAAEMGERKIREGIRQAKAYQARGGEKPFGKIGDVEIVVDVTGEAFTFVVGGEALGYASCGRSKSPVPGFYVTEIGLLPPLRGKRIGIGFYRLLLEKGETILSGAQQTPNGQRLWRRLMAMPDIEVTAARLKWNGDDMGHQDVDIRKINPWAHPDYFLIARQKVSA